MQAVANLIEQLTTQLTPSDIPVRLSDGLSTVIVPSTPRWSESPVCDSPDDVDEDEAYFLDEDDEDDDDEDDDYDEDDDDDLDDEAEDDDEVDQDKDLDEDDF